MVGGRVGLVLEPHLLARLGGGRTAALVTGTNGKTTTTRLLAAALGGRQAVATNAAGSNLPAGLVAALAGSPSKRAVLEVDEGYLARATGELDPEVVVLLNLSRDQLDRVSEVRMVAARFRAGLRHFNGTVVANADDPLVVWAATAAPNVEWVGAGALWQSDAVGCPACEGPIVFEPSGSGWSSGCGLRRPDPALSLAGDDVLLPGGLRLPLRLGLPGRFNRANAAVALAAALVLGAEPEPALAAMRKVEDVEGRFSTLQVGTVRARLLLAKNPAGWTELLELLGDGRMPVVVGINARVADGHDPSWLWDVPFERLADRQVVATGERARDLAVRLRYAGVSHVCVPDQLEALEASGSARVEYVGNYTAFQELRREVGRPGPPAGHHLRAFSPALAVPTAHESSLPFTGDGHLDSRRARLEATDPGSGPRRSRRGDGVSALRVVVLHPDLLGTYGDAGNGRVLAARAAWRGADVELVLASSGRPVPGAGDLYCLGGGEDGPELQAAGQLADSPFVRAVEAGAAVLAVCAGYQLVGRTFPDAAGAARPGLGLLDVTTVKGSGRRAVGELLADPVAPAVDAGDGGRHQPHGAGLSVGREALTGFENHSGRTRLGGGVSALAVVRRGVGNGDGTEGAWAGTVFGTYLHGPVLARNPALADLLLARATGEEPVPLDDAEERALRAERLAAVTAPAWRRVLVRRS